MSIGSETRERDNDREMVEVSIGLASSSFTGGLRAPMMLRRELVVIDDMRRMRREARDAFFSSGEGELAWTFSSALEREDNERRLPGRDADAVGRLDPADEIDMLRVSE